MATGGRPEGGGASVPAPLRASGGGRGRGAPRPAARAPCKGARDDASVSAKQSQLGAHPRLSSRRHGWGRYRNLWRWRPSQKAAKQRLVAMARAVVARRAEHAGNEHETLRAFLRNKANSARPKGFSQHGDTPGAERARDAQSLSAKQSQSGGDPAVTRRPHARPGPRPELMALAAVAGNWQGTTCGDGSRPSRRWRTAARSALEGRTRR